MKANRNGETGKPPHRSSRIFTMEQQWYFSTREGTDIGPFNSRLEANNGLQDFIQFILLANIKTLRIFLSTLNIHDKKNLFNYHKSY